MALLRRKSDEDLFRESTMTFGEHLEELRTRLFWALLWLVGGFVIGLFFADRVVQIIQEPLKGALTQYYKGAADKQIEKKIQRLRDAGLPLPGSPEQLAELVDTHNLLPEEVFLQPSEVLQQFEKVYGDMGRKATDALQRFQAARPLLKRLRLPAGDAKKKLSDQERELVASAVRSLDPACFAPPKPGVEPTADDVESIQDELERIATAIERKEGESQEDLARVAAAAARQEKGLREELDRVGQAIDLFDRTRLPVKGPHEKLRREDLVRVFIWHAIENDPRMETKAFNAPEPFMIYVKGALLVGVLIGSPGIFYHIWSFVAAGLYYHERRFVYVFGPFSLVLFVAGAAMVYFFVFPIVLQFLFTFNVWLGIGIEPRITEWLGFALILPLGFGIAFQLPLVMLFLERIGVFTIQSYLSKWRIAILVIFVLSMLLTPADPGSMLLMAMPLTALYFGGVLLCRYMPRRQSPYSEPED